MMISTLALIELPISALSFQLSAFSAWLISCSKEFAFHAERKHRRAIRAGEIHVGSVRRIGGLQRAGEGNGELAAGERVTERRVRHRADEGPGIREDIGRSGRVAKGQGQRVG